ncbi:MAG TPA: hypothetical protein VNN22_22185 [Verrucomicrobiae bacterium]|nr:hypothetical protein [Verrucomicrobiae bacterium]
MNQLCFGDNLHVLREHLKDESVDLSYLDSPFNSKRDYNLLFKPSELKPVAANVSSLKSSQSGLTSAATAEYSSEQRLKTRGLGASRPDAASGAFTKAPSARNFPGFNS